MNGIWQVGDWNVNLDAGYLYDRRGFLRRRIYPESRTMAVFAALMAERGRPVSTERLLGTVWADRIVTRDSVTTAVYQLRQLLRDDSTAPIYIRTEQGRGYRLIAPVSMQGGRSGYSRFAIPILTSCLIAVGGFAFGFLSSTASDGGQRHLSIAALEDISGDPEMKNLSVAIDATLTSALVRMNPGAVAVRTAGDEAELRMESFVVACDVGPTLVVKLLDVEGDRFVWSKAYPLEHEYPAPNLVEFVAREVTEVLIET